MEGFMFLVCKDILYGLDPDWYIKREGSKVSITIPTDNGDHEVFLFDDFPIDSLEKKNVLFKAVSITSNGITSVVHSSKSEPGIIYALLRVANCIPDDVFINKKHSSRFELIKKISYTTSEPDWGDYIATVYFVKITLKPAEFVHVYFAGENAYFLEKHIAFYCDDDMEITFKDNLQTFTTKNTNFLSLSELNSEK